jgi:UPF0755 protein
MKLLIKLMITFILMGAIVGYAALKYLEVWAETPTPVSSEIFIEFRPGTPLRSLAAQLESKKLVSNGQLFIYWMKLSGDYSTLEAGTYLFKEAISPSGIRDKLKKGDTYTPLVLQVIIPEGFTLKMLNNRLATKNVGKLSELKALVIDQHFIRSLGLNAPSLEGFTFPATYNFDKLPSATEFYKKVVKTFFEKLPKNYESDIARIGMTLTQAVTMASLIELETMRDEEKPMIAEVIFSRLKKGEPLGIDAAVIYGIQDYDGDIRTKDLKNAKNLYNTRIHRGLPPSPIGAVSTSSLLALLNPTNLGYYYYVLDSTDRTRHAFSKTLAEHNALVRKLLKSGSQTTMKRSFESN